MYIGSYPFMEAMSHLHYENTPIQIYGKFHHKKKKTDFFPTKIPIFFLFLLKT